MSTLLARASERRVPHQLYIDGAFVDAQDGRTIDVRNPHDGSLLAAVALAGAADVDRAVRAAQAALRGWSRTSAGERGRLLLKLADAIEANAAELAELETRNTGHPIRDTRGLDVPRTAATFRYFGGMADKFEGSVIPVETGFLDYVVHEPIGVVGQIVPWNFPIMFTSWKMGPALAAGNTIVLKPSEITPLTALRIAELMTEVGIPRGVVNVVPGYGAEAGERIVQHPDIGKVSFTGSSVVGKRVLAGAASNLKRVGLELGGKGANIVYDDADLERAVGGSLFAIFHNQGQACIAGSRLILHERIADEFLDKFMAIAKTIRLGDPLDPNTEMGPLTSPVHRDRVLAYCDIAREQGGEILLGGKAPAGAEFAAGYYVEPTVVRSRVSDRVAQEEVFGPFVSVATFADDAQAIAIANATQYGLGGGLWTRDLTRAHRAAAEIRSGMLWVNCYKRVHPGSPFGGMGASGHGREMGFEAMRQYTETKAVWINIDAEIPPLLQAVTSVKTLSLRDAIATFVHDGDTVALEGFTHLIPFAAGHEIIRQGRRDLTLVRMTPDIIYDQLIGMGCASKLVFSWGGNPGVGSLHRMRDAIEQRWPRPLALEEHSHADMAVRYVAGASGLPFGILRGYVGSDLPKYNANIRSIRCPFTGEQLAATPALNPDVSIVHAQQADRHGNVRIWGIVGIQKEAVLAAKRAIVTVEEVVDEFDGRNNATILPHWAVAAVCEVPGGAHPSYAHGYYARDNAFCKAWDEISRDRTTFARWMDRHVVGTADFAEFRSLASAAV